MFSPSTWTVAGRIMDPPAPQHRTDAVTPQHAVTIRRAQPADARALEALAALDSALPLRGETLVADIGGVPVAALDVAAGRAIADPLRPTASLVELLRVRAAQLHAAADTPRRLRRRRLAFGRLAGLAR